MKYIIVWTKFQNHSIFLSKAYGAMYVPEYCHYDPFLFDSTEEAMDHLKIIDYDYSEVEIITEDEWEVMKAMES